jgi:hypothetical protein
MAILIGSNHLPYTFTVAAGTTETVSSSTGETLPQGLSAVLVPTSGGTAFFEYRVSTADAWTVWEPGVVSVKTTTVLLGAVQALRVTSTTQLATVHLAR